MDNRYPRLGSGEVFVTKSDPSKTGAGLGRNSKTIYSTSTPLMMSGEDFSFSAEMKSAEGFDPSGAFEDPSSREVDDYESLLEQIKKWSDQVEGKMEMRELRDLVRSQGEWMTNNMYTL